MRAEGFDPSTLEFGTEPVLSPRFENTGNASDSGKENAEQERSDYIPIPARNKVTIAVRYHLRGRGKPLQYLLDDEIE